ncbi:MAG: hypothetical protein IKN54_00145 [Lachnospiraceae bacterium]|nr:hypothetical protein [Lachnospiraceae bacterium]
MYKIARASLGVIVIILGVLMFFAPKICTKKELRDDPAEVDKIKKSGSLIIVSGVIVVILSLN